ncbi:CobW/HypB/UreG, nucleotide-binding domain-containing protein [Hysterangium stoloniferum]|nr:CobW/HypB/UreG, nucleotide-binding domain-containing protein [Hysterangium stoloniferum]
MKCIPVTVFTGFLGAGKTSIILSLLPQLPKDYKVVLLKNEFGDIEVDSQLAKQSSLAAVSEILNGCMCCVLVGQMKTALLEIAENYAPDRIIIESSGSAFPATLAFQIRQLEQETQGGFKLDAIVTVIDAENFTGYEDKSLTAKMQAKYTDIILLNKWENVSERHLDIVIDHLNDLNDETPRLRCSGRNGVAPSLIFGLDSKLYMDSLAIFQYPDHNDEVETVTITRGSPIQHTSRHDHVHDHAHVHPRDVSIHTPEEMTTLSRDTLLQALSLLPKESIWRVKGFVRFANDNDASILNWAFGRSDFSLYQDANTVVSDEGQIQLTMMGARGETKIYARQFAKAVGAATE